MDKVIDTGTRDLLRGKNMWPKERTAFLVIHGIGEQNPFETLDAFVRGFFRVLNEIYPNKIIIKHYTKPRFKDSEFILEKDEFKDKLKLKSGELEWVENFISLVNVDQAESPIDFYEYYWAYRMEGVIAFPELIDWLIKTSDGARKFYAKNEDIVKEYEEKGDNAFRKGKFKSRWYLKHLGWFMRLVTSPIFFKPISKIPYVGSIFKFLSPVAQIFLSKAKKLFVDYMGDVAIYTTTDVKSKHYNVRKSILDDSLKEVKTLIDDERYKKIVIAGHSLGSVIAFDTLNRVNHAFNIQPEEWRYARKIEGLITFGSPLDKIAFFFREHTQKEQYIRRQILAHFHCFKSRKLSLEGNEVEIDNPIERLLDDIKWINFWDEKDPVSGHLDFYIVDDNIPLAMKEKYGVAHNAYWDNEKNDGMYAKICEYFLR
jgi:hypothetical protein